ERRAFPHCFINFYDKDPEFVERLFSDLRKIAFPSRFVYVYVVTRPYSGVSGVFDDFRPKRDRLLLVLDDYTIQCPWMEKAVLAAFQQEERAGRTVLFPIRLDDSIMKTTKSWAAILRRTRHIGDFTQWRQHAEYAKAFTRLVRDLKMGPEDFEEVETVR